jgi:hypothetical protein
MPDINSFIKMQKLADLTVGALKAQRVASMAIMKGEELDASFFTGNYADVGDTMKIGLELEFEAKEHNPDGNTPDAITEQSVDLKLDKIFTVDKSVSTLDLTTMSERKMQDIALASAEALDVKLDQYLLSEMVRNSVLYNIQATPSKKEILQLRNILNKNKVSVLGRNLILDTDTETDILSLEEILDASYRADGGQSFKEAQIGRVFGMTTFMTQHAKALGISTSNLAVNNATGYGKGDRAITFDGGSSSNLEIGDMIKFGSDNNYYTVNDVSWNTAASSGTATLSSGLVNAVSDNAVMNVIKASWAMAIQRAAMVWGTRPLKPPVGGVLSYTAISRDGYSIRAVLGYDQSKKRELLTFDILVGSKVLKPEGIVRYPKTA